MIRVVELGIVLAGALGLITCAQRQTSPPAAITGAAITAIPTTALASPTPMLTARAVASQYLAAWTNGRYAEMYTQLAAANRAALSAEDFAAENRKWLTIITAVRLAAVITAVTEQGDQAQATVHMRYTTALVGLLETDLTVPLRHEAGKWRVVFSPALIWPELVNGQTLLMVPVVPERGRLFDRDGVALAYSTDVYAIGIVPGELPADDPVPAAIGRLLGIAPRLIAERYANAIPGQYFPLAEASAEVIDARFGFLKEVPGVYLTPYAGRYYPGQGAAASVTGYLTFITPEELTDYRAQGYSGSERVGRAGLESWGEPYLAGRAGGQLQLRDSANRFLRMVAQTRARAAQDVYASIDFDLQRAAQAALGALPGAVVALDLNSGEVLALASSPTFDVNLFDPGNYNNLALGSVMDNPQHPFLNHATQATYPAGSVFKIVTMAAGLNSGLFKPDTLYTCTGEWDEIKDPSFAPRTDWKAGGHGRITLVEGLAGSSNPYFWHVGFALHNWDPRWLSKTARAFGFGQRTQTQLDEDTGVIPDPDWKQTRGEAWTVIDSLNLAVGQGDVLVTPLQMARLAAAVANGGKLLQPQLVKEVRPPDNGSAPTLILKPIVTSTLPLAPDQLTAIQTAMKHVVSGPLGTARNRFRGLPICLAGKTGTAEDPGFSGEQAPDAWFVGYTCEARVDQPDIAIAVVVQNQGQGSEFAAPIFRRVVEAYFGLSLARYPWEEAVGVPAPAVSETPAAPNTPSP